jgi:hypothetical protein
MQIRRESEISYLNNYFKQSFLVKGDQLNPFLEVTFDGIRIFNRDIVSPNPIIRISSVDKNQYLLQKIRKPLNCM